MKKIFLFVFGTLSMGFLFFNHAPEVYAAQNPYYQGEVIQPQNPYYVDIDELKRNMRMSEYARRGALINAGQDPMQGRDQAQLQQAEALYQAQLANQAGVPYEVYLCNGDYVCIQRYEMQQQRINAMNNYSEALKNQRIKIDANVNYQGNVNHRIYW